MLGKTATSDKVVPIQRDARRDSKGVLPQDVLVVVESPMSAVRRLFEKHLMLEDLHWRWQSYTTEELSAERARLEAMAQKAVDPRRRAPVLQPSEKLSLPKKWVIEIINPHEGKVLATCIGKCEKSLSVEVQRYFRGNHARGAWPGTDT